LAELFQQELAVSLVGAFAFGAGSSIDKDDAMFVDHQLSPTYIEDYGESIETLELPSDCRACRELNRDLIARLESLE